MVRSQNLPNITRSAGGIITDGNGRVVLICENGNFWGFPKGRIEAGEEALEAAIREVKEEAGITSLDLIKPLGEFKRHPFTADNKEDESELKIIQMFLFQTDQTELLPLEANTQAAWVPMNEAAEMLTHPADRAFFVNIKDVIR